MDINGGSVKISQELSVHRFFSTENNSLPTSTTLETKQFSSFSPSSLIISDNYHHTFQDYPIIFISFGNVYYMLLWSNTFFSNHSSTISFQWIIITTSTQCIS